MQSPTHQGHFEADVTSGLFAFDPFVFQDLFAFGEEFLIKRDFGGGFFGFRGHTLRGDAGAGLQFSTEDGIVHPIAA